MEITNQLAHVVTNENLFVSEVQKTDQDNQFASTFIIDGRHPYLYENPAIANHVSGTTFLDVSRQLLKAITHLFYAVPLTNRFVIRSAHMDFGRWTKLNVPIEAVVELTPDRIKLRGQECINYVARVSFYQEGRVTGSITGQFSTFPQAIEDLLMERQYRQSPAAALAQRAG